MYNVSNNKENEIKQAELQPAWWLPDLRENQNSIIKVSRKTPLLSGIFVLQSFHCLSF